LEADRRRSRAEFRFTLDERRVNQVRLMLSNAVLLMTDERLLSSRVAMTGAELIDFALKTVKGDLFLALTLDPKKSWVQLEMESQASLDRALEVERLVSDVARGDAREVYVRALQRAPELGVGSQELRLARIRYEGRMDLRFERTPGGMKIVSETTSGAAT
jgi:hypothetical protein